MKEPYIKGRPKGRPVDMECHDFMRQQIQAALMRMGWGKWPAWDEAGQLAWVFLDRNRPPETMEPDEFAELEDCGMRIYGANHQPSAAERK